jgi:hypothetical protein
LVLVTAVAATTAPSTKTRHTCGAGICRLTFGAVVVAGVASHKHTRKASAAPHLARQATGANQTAPNLEEQIDKEIGVDNDDARVYCYGGRCRIFHIQDLSNNKQIGDLSHSLAGICTQRNVNVLMSRV